MFMYIIHVTYVSPYTHIIWHEIQYVSGYDSKYGRTHFLSVIYSAWKQKRYHGRIHSSTDEG